LTEVVLHLGSNIGFKAINLELARIMVYNHVGPIKSTSHVYKTSAWGNTNQEDFYNQAVLCYSSLAPEEVLQRVKQIEERMGRAESEHWGPRIIDIDIIFYGDKIVDKEHLKIPHPQLTNRNFVLVPLLDICPQKVHPVSHKTVESLSQECQDKGTVTLVDIDDY